jgi:hypothetical protein
VIAYRVMLDVPRELIVYVAGLLRAERTARGTRTGTRALTCFRQAAFVIVWFRDRPDITRLGRGFGISQATAYRYLTEGIAVLAAQAPDLREALERATAQSLTHLILDGKTVACDRVRETKTSRKGKQIDAWYSGKTHDFGGLIQALMDPAGIPLWISEVLPGSVHDITAAREQVLAVLAPYLNELPVLADGGYEGAGHGVHTPVKQSKDGYELDPDTRTYNRLLRGLRCLGERGFALLTQRWTTLQHVMLSPRRIGRIARAALVLTHFEHRIIR